LQTWYPHPSADRGQIWKCARRSALRNQNMFCSTEYRWPLATVCHHTLRHRIVSYINPVLIGDLRTAQNTENRISSINHMCYPTFHRPNRIDILRCVLFMLTKFIYSILLDVDKLKNSKYSQIECFVVVFCRCNYVEISSGY